MCAAVISGSRGGGTYNDIVEQLMCMAFRETADDRVLPLLEGLVSFFEAQETVVAGYTLDGLPLENYTHTCFQAPVWCLFSVRSVSYTCADRCRVQALERWRLGQLVGRISFLADPRHSLKYAASQADNKGLVDANWTDIQLPADFS